MEAPCWSPTTLRAQMSALNEAGILLSQNNHLPTRGLIAPHTYMSWVAL